MKTIQILGMGCQKCVKLYEHAEQAAKELGIDYKIEKVNDITVISAMGVMSTPALAVDGKVKSSGRVLSSEAIKPYLK